MIAKIRCVIFIMSIFFLGVSCTTLDSMRVSRFSDGIAQTYNVAYKDAFDLAIHACRVHSFEIEHKDIENKVIVANNGMSFTSYGERIGIYFKEVDQETTAISVVTKAKMKTNIFAPDWDTEIHTSIRQRIAQLSEVGQL